MDDLANSRMLSIASLTTVLAGIGSSMHIDPRLFPHFAHAGTDVDADLLRTSLGRCGETFGQVVLSKNCSSVAGMNRVLEA